MLHPVLEKPDPPRGLGQVSIDAELADPTYPKAVRLMDYWRQKHSGALPHWTDIRPREIPSLLPFVFLANRRAGDWWFRLAGTSIRTRFGVECTGHSLSDCFVAETATECRRLYDAAVSQAQPVNIRGRWYGLGIKHAIVEAVQLPVIGRDGTVWIFGGVFFDERPLVHDPFDSLSIGRPGIRQRAPSFPF